MTIEPPVTAIDWPRTCRLVPSRYPTIGVFDRVASPQDLPELFELEGWTNDRLSNELGLLNTVLYFPSGAVYPQQGFPGWMKVIAVLDPFTYAVHAFKSLLLKNTGFDAIAYDLAYLVVFSMICMTAATFLFKRTL